LLIYSNDGCIQVDQQGIRYLACPVNFSGTLVNITLQCDASVYDLDTANAGADDTEGENWF